MTEVADPFKGLPRRIVIGAYTFRVLVVPADDPMLEGNDAMAYLGRFRIYVHADLGQRLLEVVQHELTHCINWVYGIDDDSSEEQFTTNHSKGLTELWIRNPRLWAWYGKTLRNLRKEGKIE